MLAGSIKCFLFFIFFYFVKIFTANLFLTKVLYFLLLGGTVFCGKATVFPALVSAWPGMGRQGNVSNRLKGQQEKHS